MHKDSYFTKMAPNVFFFNAGAICLAAPFPSPQDFNNPFLFVYRFVGSLRDGFDFFPQFVASFAS